MSTLRKAMNRHEFIKRCVRGGATYVQPGRGRSGEYRLIFPDGQRLNGNARKKYVGKQALAMARANDIDID